MLKPCIIVASGPSASGFVAPAHIPVIAVNGAIEWLNRADYAFTLDPSKVNTARMLPHNQRPGVNYVAAVPVGYPLPANVTRYNRVAKRGAEPTDKKSVEWVLWRYSCVKGINTTPGHINTGNSSWGALGLAYHLGFTDVALIGVDGSTDLKVDGGNSYELRHLNPLFASALPQINVVSCGKLNSIPQMSFDQWLAKINL
ncbi:hypothetical protein [Rheinheimera sp. MM224]|uniref:hypothetical protein n=1 Tax=Rheinheimera sp. MM224 TaxID=3019969 RepID=UPI0021F81F4A|nr:hypothetical protein [Rheinheimera sp. MM224]CAI3796020.1 hypothetical protein JAMGFMIE_01463 [Rheinheimera sp. MM224]